jgi:hypothetical protein
MRSDTPSSARGGREVGEELADEAMRASWDDDARD